MFRGLLERWRDAVAAALVGLVPFGAYWRLWIRGPRAEHLYGDTCGLYWPDLVYLYRAFTHLQLPLWNPFERGGVSMLSEPEAGVLYPLNWLLVALGAVSGGMPFVMIEIKACLHLAIGGVAMFALLRRKGLSSPGAAIGGVIYELGPYTAGNAYFAIVWPQAWLPLLMLATDWLVEAAASTRRWGSPPPRSSSSSQDRRRRRSTVRWSRPLLLRAGRPRGASRRVAPLARAKRPAACLLAGVLTALSCYPSVRGTFEAMRASVRAVRTFAYVSESPLPVREWLGFVAARGLRRPRLRRASVGHARGPGRGPMAIRAEAILFAALAFVGVLLMLGSATPLLGWLYAWAPPFRLFRICVRYVFLVQVAVSVLAAHGFEALAELRAPALDAGLRGELALPLAAAA